MGKIKIQEVVEVYFRAMGACYLSDGKENANVTMAKSRGETTFIYQEKDFTFEDTYADNSGITKIFWKGQMAWSMYYRGHYPKELIPVLKKALCANTEQRRWNGGRGPIKMEIQNGEEKFIYRNDSNGNPANFSGCETISSPFLNGKDYKNCYHEYWGMAEEGLVDCPPVYE